MNETVELQPRRRFSWGAIIGPGLLLVAALAGFLEFNPWKKASHSRNRAFQTVVIDAGHGGYDSGALGNGVREKDLCLDMALRLDVLLRAQGYHTVLTRRDDRFIPLPERARIANREKNSIFVSIHFNQTDNRMASGIETWETVAKSGNPTDDLMSLLHLAKNTPVNRSDDSLARAVQEELISATGAVDRGVKQRNLYVVRNVQSPAVLVECGFVSNPRTVQSLQSKTYRAKMAAAIARGLFKYRNGWEPAPTLLAKLDQ